MRGCYALIGVNEAVRRLGEFMATKKQVVPAKKSASVTRKKGGPKVGAADNAGPVRARRKRNSKSALVRKLLDAAEKRVAEDDVKASIGDVIRLLQLQTELEQEEPREIRIQWIGREEKGHADEK